MRWCGCTHVRTTCHSSHVEVRGQLEESVLSVLSFHHVDLRCKLRFSGFTGNTLYILLPILLAFLQLPFIVIQSKEFDYGLTISLYHCSLFIFSITGDFMSHPHAYTHMFMCREFYPNSTLEKHGIFCLSSSSN